MSVQSNMLSGKEVCETGSLIIIIQPSDGWYSCNVGTIPPELFQSASLTEVILVKVLPGCHLYVLCPPALHDVMQQMRPFCPHAPNFVGAKPSEW